MILAAFTGHRDFNVGAYATTTVDPKILHDPKYSRPWEYWYYGILRSCRIFSFNSGMMVLDSRYAYGMGYLR